ncbi:MAG TPA: TetR/AcrR family transcriptional regulator [Gemmatimonadaceae bacterium]|jgi:AcrR family transcriptional regulator
MVNDKDNAPVDTADLDANTETKILDAAHAVFLRVGTAGARMQEIADEAGVNKALLHYYFRNKERLAAGVFERVARGLFARLGMVATADADLETKVRRIIGTYLDEFTKTPYAPGYLICEMNQNPDRATHLLNMLGGPITGGPPAVPFLAALAKQIEEGVAAGHMRPIAPRQFLANLVSLCVFPFAARPMLCAVFRMDDAGFREFIDERKATLPDLFLNSLRP